MHYFIDGYNLLFRTIHNDDELQKQRDYLLKDLTAKLEFLTMDVTIVFDAAFSPGDATYSRRHHVNIVFTAAGESADNFILVELQSITRPYQETVVTSDKQLASQVRRLGGKTIDIAPFVAWLDSRYNNKLRKLKKQHPKPEKLSPPPKVRVPAAAPEALPKVTETPEGCFDYYIHAFEKRLKEQPIPEKTSPKRKKKLPPPAEPQLQDEVVLSDEERYLRLFTKRLEEELEGKG